MKNIEAAKELLKKYKSITLEQLKHWYRISPNYKGKIIMQSFTDFGTTHCILCISASHICSTCIYSFIEEKPILKCKDIIYKEIENATSAEELYN